MMTKKNQEKIALLMNKLELTEQEAMELLAFDQEVDKMSVKEASAGMPSAAKVSKTGGTKKEVKKPAKKNESGYTPNQEKALEILKSSQEAMTGKMIAEASEGMLNSRGLGAVVKKLIEQGLVEKIEGSPVQYKFIG